MSPANHYQLAALLTALINVALLFIVSKKKPRTRLNRHFLLYCFFIVLWSAFVTLATTTNNPQWSLLCSRICHGSAVFIPVLFLQFVYTFLGAQRKFYTLPLFFTLAAFYLLVILFYPLLFFKGVAPQLGFSCFPEAGYLFTSWVIFFFVTVSFALYKLLSAFLASRGIRRKQLKFFFLANLLGYLGGIGCFLPVYGIGCFPFPYGSYGVVLFSVVTAYSILMHKFLDIEVIIKKTLVFAGISFSLFAFFAATFFVITGVYQETLSDAMRLWLFAFAGMIVAIVVRPLDAFLVRVTDRYLFQKRYDYKTLLKEASQEMATIKSLQKLAKVVVAFLIRKARISRAILFVRSEETPGFSMIACRPLYRGEYRQLKKEHALIRALERDKRPLERSIIANDLRNEPSAEEERELREILALMDDCKVDVIIPSFLYMEEGRKNTEGHQALLRCLLFLGPKKSDEEYNQEDLDVFYTLAQESAIAVENARLFDEAVNRSCELEKMNEELQEMNKRLQVTQASLIVAEKSATMVGMAKAIGHEVNNPLSAVIYRAQLVDRSGVDALQAWMEKKGDSLSEEDRAILGKILTNVRDHSKRIKHSGDRIAVVVKTLTNIMKEAKGEMSPLSLTVLCREAIEATRFSTYEENLAGCDIKEWIAANIIVRGNLEQLIQVFVNLIKNSYEAMINQRERKIVIRGEIDEADPAMAKIEIADNGPGIPPEAIPKIWQQGFSTKKKIDDSIGAAGQGQGLFICKHMIESVHKGSITVESEVGKGTTFIIKLPIAEIGQDA